jgi:hypothetical protein
MIIGHNDAILADDKTASLADRLSLAINGHNNNDSRAILSVDLVSITQAKGGDKEDSQEQTGAQDFHCWRMVGF